MRPSAPLIGPECYRNLRDLHPQFCRLDDKLEREFHARGPGIDLQVNALGKSAHAAVRVAHTCMEKFIEDGSDGGITQMLMQAWHGARLDFAAKAISHDQFRTRAPLANEQRDLGEIVAVVGVPHDYELSPGFFDPLAQSVAITTSAGVHDAGTVLLSDFERAVGRTIVSDNNLSGNAHLSEDCQCFIDAEPK